MGRSKSTLTLGHHAYSKKAATTSMLVTAFCCFHSACGTHNRIPDKILNQRKPKKLKSPDKKKRGQFKESLSLLPNLSRKQRTGKSVRCFKGLYQVLRENRSPQRGQVMVIFPLPRGTRSRFRQEGQRKNRWVLRHLKRRCWLTNH